MLALSYDYIKNKDISISFVRYGIIILMSVFIATAYSSTSIQFETWKKDPLSQFLLPPFESTYFYTYSAYHFWLPYFLDLAIALAWTFYLLLLSKYSNKRFLDEKDVYLGFFTSLIIGWPNFIIYVFIVFGLLVIKQTTNYLIFRKKTLIPIAPYMIIATIAVLSTSLYYSDRLGLDKLKLVA